MHNQQSSPRKVQDDPDPAIPASKGNLEAIFDSMTEMTRNFAQLAAAQSGNPQFLAELDNRLAQGWMLRLQFCVGGAGALGWSLVAVDRQGEVFHVMNVDAPPSAVAFRLDPSRR